MHWLETNLLHSFTCIFISIKTCWIFNVSNIFCGKSLVATQSSFLYSICYCKTCEYYHSSFLIQVNLWGSTLGVFIALMGILLVVLRSNYFFFHIKCSYMKPAAVVNVQWKQDMAVEPSSTHLCFSRGCREVR